MTEKLELVKVVAEGLITSFRYPHFMWQKQPTFEMPPPATIYGHICSAVMTGARAGGGTLYVVATPICNLDDLSPRARAVLAKTDVIAAEDTRHTRGLLSSISAESRLIAYHEHNEEQRVPELLFVPRLIAHRGLRPAQRPPPLSPLVPQNRPPRPGLQG